MPRPIILVVEDNDDVRRVFTAILRLHGFAVVASSDGEAALGLMEQLEGRIDAVVTDVILPKMSGFQLMDTIWLEYPSTPVVFTSGYNVSEEFETHRYAQVGVELLAKPFRYEALIQAVTTVLKSKRPAADELPLK